MGIADPGSLSLGEWFERCRHWNKAHGDGKPPAPTEEEFDLAVMRARGTA